MGSWRQLLLVSHILINLAGFTIAQPKMLYHACLENGNYTSNSTYQTNLNTLLSSLSSKIDQYGFSSSSVGENPDKVNAIVLCRGDVGQDLCRTCINESTSKLIQLCPNYKDAIGGEDNCMLRYSNKSLNGIMTVDPRFFVWSKNNVSSVDQFSQSLTTLLRSLGSKAAAGGSQLKLATGSTAGPDSQTIYALVQCTPDISEQDCNKCLDAAYGDLPECCNGRIGGRVIRPSCNFRYETNSHFYNEISADGPTAPAVPAAPAATPGKDNNKARTIDNTTPTVIIIIVSLLLFPLFL